jgi:hypothetical protein
MSDLEIARLDPFDPAAFDAWHAAYLAAEQAGADGVTAPLMLEEVRAQLQDRGTRRWNGGWTGTVNGRVVVAGRLGMPCSTTATGRTCRSTSSPTSDAAASGP